jgi:hypothetical protein
LTGVRPVRCLQGCASAQGEVRRIEAMACHFTPKGRRLSDVNTPGPYRSVKETAYPLAVMKSPELLPKAFPVTN